MSFWDESSIFKLAMSGQLISMLMIFMKEVNSFSKGSFSVNLNKIALIRNFGVMTNSSLIDYVKKCIESGWRYYASPKTRS